MIFCLCTLVHKTFVRITANLSHSQLIVLAQQQLIICFTWQVHKISVNWKRLPKKDQDFLCHKMLLVLNDIDPFKFIQSNQATIVNQKEKSYEQRVSIKSRTRDD